METGGSEAIPCGKSKQKFTSTPAQTHWSSWEGGGGAHTTENDRGENKGRQS